MSFRGEFDLEAPTYSVTNEPFIAKLTATDDRGSCEVPIDKLDISVRPGVGLKPTLSRTANGGVEITYKPVQKGKFDLIIRAFDQPVFEWGVTATGPVSPSHSYGMAEARYFTKQRSKLTIVSCDSDGTQVKAGSPDVDINYEGPGELNEMGLEELEDRNLALFFVAQKPGEYEISLKIGGRHLRNSPLKVNVA